MSFSAQEWCGHTYAQLLFDARYARYVAHSYFDAEADTQSSVPMPADAQSEDALLVWARATGAFACSRSSRLGRDARESHQMGGF